MAYIGWGVYVIGRVDGRREEAQGGLARGGASRRQGPLAVDGGLSVGLPALPQLATSTTTNGRRPATTEAFIEDYLGSNADSYNHPNAAIEPRIPGIFQYYSIAEDELAKGFAGQYKSAQETADAIAAAWEKITDQIGRDSQIKLYKASLGTVARRGAALRMRTALAARRRRQSARCRHRVHPARR